MIPAQDLAFAPMPITPIGLITSPVNDTAYAFCDSRGTHSDLTFAELCQRPLLVRLCWGDVWLQENFPLEFIVVPQRSGGGRRVPLGIDTIRAARWLANQCLVAELRKPTPLPPKTSLWARARAAVAAMTGPMPISSAVHLVVAGNLLAVAPTAPRRLIRTIANMLVNDRTPPDGFFLVADVLSEAAAERFGVGDQRIDPVDLFRLSAFCVNAAMARGAVRQKLVPERTTESLWPALVD